MEIVNVTQRLKSHVNALEINLCHPSFIGQHGRPQNHKFKASYIVIIFKK